MLFVPQEARLSRLVALEEGADLGAAIDDAMRAVEVHNPELRDELPKDYQRLEKSMLIELLRLFSPSPASLAATRSG